jgi:hypothetical protein
MGKLIGLPSMIGDGKPPAPLSNLFRLNTILILRDLLRNCLLAVSSPDGQSSFSRYRSGARDDSPISLKRAVAQGVKLGRPNIDSATERKVRKRLAKGVGILKVAKSLGIGTGTVQRISKERAMSPRGAEQ